MATGVGALTWGRSNLSCDSLILMLVIFGLSLLLLPDIITRKRKGTYYAITNRRVISLFDGKGTNFLGRFLPANVKLVELPIDTIKDVAIEKYTISNLVGVIFTDASNFFLPPYTISTSDGDEKVNANTLLYNSSIPYGYRRSYPGNENNIFSFCSITKGEAEEITRLIKRRLSS